MSFLLKKLLGVTYMAQADDGDAGGGGTVDRGDDFTPTDDKVDDKKVDDKVEDEDDKSEDKADDDAADEDKDEDAAEDKDEEEKEEQPREKGKFAKKPQQIPKARFDEARQKARDREAALQARILELERQTQREVQQADVGKLEKEVEDLEEAYQKLLDDGETSKAKEVMREIRLKERQIVASQVEHKTEHSRLLAVEQFKVDSLIEKLEVEFPALNPDADEYDQEAVDEVVFLRQSFEKAGLPSSAAIAKAVKYVFGSAKKEEVVEEETEEKKPRGLNADKKKEERRQEQLKKNIDVAKKQPPKLDSTGVDSHKKGGGLDTARVSEMSEEDFNALPASTKARLRGDIIEDVAT